MNATEEFDFDHIHTTPAGRHFRHGDGVEVDGEGLPIGKRPEPTLTAEDGSWMSYSVAPTIPKNLSD